MKASLISFSLLVAFSPAAEPPVRSLEFAGYFTTGSDVMFVVVDPASKETSSRLKLGDRWKGYRPIAFDAQREILVVSNDAETFQLKLRASKVVQSGTTPKLLKGTFSVVGDTIVYSEDAEVSFSPKWTVRAGNGAMSYNTIEGTLRGNLVMDHASHPMLVIAKEGVVKLKDGSPIVSASEMGVQKRPNKAPEPTPTSVTSPAAQEPRQP